MSAHLHDGVVGEARRWVRGYSLEGIAVEAGVAAAGVGAGWRGFEAESSRVEDGPDSWFSGQFADEVVGGFGDVFCVVVALALTSWKRTKKQ